MIGLNKKNARERERGREGERERGREREGGGNHFGQDEYENSNVEQDAGKNRCRRLQERAAATWISSKRGASISRVLGFQPPVLGLVPGSK